jgi:hypothetical protein
LEVVLHWLFGLGSKWGFRFTHWRAKKHWSDFWQRKKQQAVPKLAEIIRDTGRSAVEKLHAAETLGLVVNQRFHQAADSVAAAEAWLRQAGR